jgi:hypothetical protein
VLNHSHQKKLFLCMCSIPDADFHDEHMIILCPYVARNNIVTDLNLSSNVFSDDGARALARAIRKNTTLKKLDLRVKILLPVMSECICYIASEYDMMFCFCPVLHVASCCCLIK